jgi:hypothetical protein
MSVHIWTIARALCLLLSHPFLLLLLSLLFLLLLPGDDQHTAGPGSQVLPR